MQINIRNNLNVVLFYIANLIVGTAIYIAFFSADLMKSNSIPLAGPLGLLTILCIVFSTFLFILKSKRKTPVLFTYRDITLNMVLLFFLNYNLYVMIPFNCSRSNSIIIVGYLLKNIPAPKTKIEIEEFVKEEYFEKYQAIQKRLDEQTTAGNIREINGKYELTPQGVFVVKAFGFITDLYHTDKNFTEL
jgi:hypothetical protein